MFGTTRAFLDYFGLKRLDELPPLSELRDIGELEPQLPLGDDGQLAAPLAAAAATPEAAAADDDAGRGDTDTAAAPDDGDAAPDTAPTGEPDAAPGERAAEVEDTGNNAVATTTVAVDEADPEPEADEENAGRSQTE